MALSSSNLEAIACQIDWKVQASSLVVVLLFEFYLGKSKKISQSSSVELIITVLTVVAGIAINLIRRKKNESNTDHRK